MGICINYRLETSTITEEQAKETVALTKRMAQEAGFDFTEIEESGLVYIEETPWIDGKTNKKRQFVGNDWHYGLYPQIRMDAMRSEDSYRTRRFGIIVNPPNTESFTMEWTGCEDGRYFMPFAFTKTQPFSGEDPAINAQSHIWIISVLVTIKKNIIPELYINDESDFFVEEPDEKTLKYWRELKEQGKTDYEARHREYIKDNFSLKRLMESFGESLAMIQAIGGQLQQQFGAGNVVTGAHIETHKVVEDSVKSTGTADGNKYIYRMFEKARIILEEVGTTPRRVAIPVDVPKYTTTLKEEHRESVREVENALNSKRTSLTELAAEFNNQGEGGVAESTPPDKKSELQKLAKSFK